MIPRILFYLLLIIILSIMSFRGGNMVSLGRVLPSNAFKYNLFNFALDGKAKKIANLFSDSGGDLNVDIFNSRGQTALFVSCITGHYKCVLTLLQLGADPNKRSDDGSTPTHAAAFSCIIAILKASLDHGGDLRLHDYRDLAPRDWAVEAGPKKNKKVLEFVDKLHNDAVSTILASNNLLSYKFKKSSSPSLSRIRSNNDVLPATTTKPARQCKVYQQGFGDFASVPIIGSCIALSPEQAEVGYLSLTPLVNKEHLFNAATEPSITYQAPPWFILTNGFWGAQAVTIKKINRVKKKVSRQYVNTHDLLISELNTTRLLNHPNILLMMGVCMESWNDKCDSDSPVLNDPIMPHCFVYERVSLGSLYHVLHVKQHLLSLKDSTLLLLQVADALSYVHQRGFIHCCISSYSIQIVNSYTAKLSDFYYAVYIEGNNNESTQQVYPAFNRWLAPEILAEKRPSVESDIYSFCVVACEAMSGTLPWRGFDPDSIRHHVVAKGHVQPIPVEVPEYFRPILSQGLCLSRRKRAIKLSQITFSLQYVYKYGNAMTCEEIDPSNIFSPASSPVKFDKTHGDMGLDVPDAVPFDTSERSKSRRSVATDGKPQTSEASKANRSFSVGDTQLSEMLQPSMHTTRCMSRDSTNSNTARPVSLPAVGTRQSSIRVSIHSGDFYPKAHNSDDDIGCVHPDLCSTDSANSSIAGSSIFYPSKNYDSSHLDDTNSTQMKARNQDAETSVLNDSVTVKREETHAVCLTKLELPTIVKAESEDTGELSCHSPYPNLDECKSSLGDYVLSGMSGNEGEAALKQDEVDYSPVSVTSSYLGNVFPRCSGGSAPDQDSKQDDDKKSITDDKRHSGGSVMNEINLQEQERESPLHTSVQKVRHSLAELTMMFHAPPDDINPCILEVGESPPKIINEHETQFVHHDSSSESPSEPVGDVQFEHYPSDENFKLPHAASTFFDEVISATGMRDLPSVSEMREHRISSQSDSQSTSPSLDGERTPSKKSSVVFTNVTEWKEAIKRAAKKQAEQAAKRTRKRKKSKPRQHNLSSEKPNQLDIPPENRNYDHEMCATEPKVSSENLKVLFSSFKQPGTSKSNLTKKNSLRDLKSNETVRLRSDHANPFSTDGTTDGCSSSLQTTSIDGKPMPHPSAFFPYEDISTPSTNEETPKIPSSHKVCLRNPFPNATSQKRYSITSADLEDIFSDFADRPSAEKIVASTAQTSSKTDLCNQPVYEPQSNCDFNSSSGLDVPDGMAIPVCLSKVDVPDVPSKEVKRKKIMMSKGCQTDYKKSHRNIQVDGKHLKTTIDVAVSNIMLHAKSPPVVNDFLQRTGDWTSVFNDLDKKKSLTIQEPVSNDIIDEKMLTEAHPSITTEHPPTVATHNPAQVGCCGESFSSANKVTSVEPSPSLTTLLTNTLKPAMQPASHMQPHDVTYCVAKNPQPSHSSSTTNVPKLNSVSDDWVDGRTSFGKEQVEPTVRLEAQTMPQLTPSKLSFQNKLSLFESKLTPKSLPISPERASSADQVVLQTMSGIPCPKPIYQTNSLKQVCGKGNLSNASRQSEDCQQVSKGGSSYHVDDASRAYITALEEDELRNASPTSGQLSTSYEQDDSFKTSTPILNKNTTVCPGASAHAEEDAVSKTRSVCDEPSSLSSQLQGTGDLAPSQKCDVKACMKDQETQARLSFTPVNPASYLLRRRSSLQRKSSLPDVRVLRDLKSCGEDNPRTLKLVGPPEADEEPVTKPNLPPLSNTNSSSTVSEDFSASDASSSSNASSILEEGIDSLAEYVAEDVLRGLMCSNNADSYENDNTCEDSIYVDAGKNRNEAENAPPVSENYAATILLESHYLNDSFVDASSENDVGVSDGSEEIPESPIKNDPSISCDT